MMSSTLAEKRVNDFKNKYGEVALQLAYHAALPVALNADLLHLLRINFFLDPPATLPYTAEFELLLSPLCREIDEGLYEIEPEIRDILLQGLCSIDNGQRIKDVATLLWQYIERDAVWHDRVELERAQQLTVLNFLDAGKAEEWLAEVKQEIDTGENVERDWYIAMQQEIDRHPQVIKKVPEEIGLAQKMRQDFYREILERHLDDLKAMIAEDFTGHSYNLDFNLNSREFSENIEEVKINDVTNVNIISISKSVTASGETAIFEVFAQIVFSVKVTMFDEKILVRGLYEGTSYPTTTGLIQNQSVDATARVTTIHTDDKIPDLEIESIELMMQRPIVVNYQDIVFKESDNQEENYNEEDTIELNLLHLHEEVSSNIENENNDISKSQPIQTINIHVDSTKEYHANIEQGKRVLLSAIDRDNSTTSQLPPPDRQLPTDLDTMPMSKPSTVGKFTPEAKTTIAKKQPDAAKLRKIRENIATLRNSRSTDLEKIGALKALGRATDNEQAIQAILSLARTNKNNDVITEAVKSLGNIGKKDASVLQEMVRLLRSSSNNLVIVEALTSLGKIGNTDPTTIRAILHLLALNRNSSVIINIMKTFASIAKGNNEVIQKILSLLPNNNDTSVKKSMIESLGEIASGNRSAINQLISILRFSPNAPILKQFAANSLGKIAEGDKDAISAMESELKFSLIKAVKERVLVNLNKIDPGNQTAANYRAKANKARSTKK